MRFVLSAVFSVALLGDAVSADSVEQLVDHVFSAGANERDAARKEVLARGDGVLRQLLAGLEARRVRDEPTLVFYDVADLASGLAKDEAAAWKKLRGRIGRIAELLGDPGHVLVVTTVFI